MPDINPPVTRWESVLYPCSPSLCRTAWYCWRSWIWMDGWFMLGHWAIFLSPPSTISPSTRELWNQLLARSHSTGLSNQTCQRFTWRLWSLRLCLAVIKSPPREGVLPALPSRVWAMLWRDRHRGCKGLLCRLQKEQKHAKTIPLKFQQPHLASLPPSTCIQRCTAISKSPLSCPAGPSCAPHSFLPWAGQVCAGATAPAQRWKPRSEHWQQVGGVQERTTPGCRELTATQTAKVIYFFKHPLLWH